MFWLNVSICYLRPIIGWNICESLKSWHMTESAKDKQSWMCILFLVNKSRALAEISQSSTFKTDHTQHFHFYAVFFLHANSHLTTKPFIFDLKCQSNFESYDWHNFLGPSLRVVRIFFYLRWEVFSTKRKYSGIDWMDLLLLVLISAHIKNSVSSVFRMISLILIFTINV